MKFYRIRNWDKLYENNRTRDMVHMAWVPVPNRHDGDGYTILVDRKNGAAYLGAWLAILQVASKCTPRGTLLREADLPHTSESISRITRIPKEIISDAFDILVKECKWLDIITLGDASHEGAEIPQVSAAIPHPTDEERNGTEQKGIEQKDGDLFTKAEEVYKLYPRKVGKPAALTKIRVAITKFGFEVVSAATARFSKAWEGCGDEIQYCPHPATWFHQERFNDAPETWERKASGKLTPSEQRNALIAGDRQKHSQTLAEIVARENA